MPGLSQLKEFVKDLRALGKETELLASRGEKPVPVVFPKSIKDIDDSEDFVLGMPELSEEEMQLAETSSVPEDFSDITNTENKTESAVEPAAEAAALDFSDLMNIAPHVEADMSAFAEEEEPEVEEEVAEEKAETSIADMGLDALLGGNFEEETENEPAAKKPSESGMQQKEEPASFEDDILHAIPKAEHAPSPFDGSDISTPKKEPASPFDIPDLPDENFFEAEKNAGEKNEAPFEDFTIPETKESAEAAQKEGGDTFSVPETSAADFAVTDDFELPDINEENFAQSNEPDSLQSEPNVAESGNEEKNLSGFENLEAGDSEKKDAESGLERSSETAGGTSDEIPPDFTGAADFPQDEKKQDTTANPADDFDFSGEAIDMNVDSLFESGSDKGALGNDAFVEYADENEPVQNADENVSENEAPAGTRPSLEERMRDDNETSSEEAASAEESAPLEKFDTTEMEGLDFTENVSPSPMSDTDFEIPGFSDTNEIKTDKRGKPKLSGADFPGASEDDKPAKNSLTEKQYKKFRENFSQYPLNVRIALEKLLVENEFTDDAQFEIVEKVLNKVPARQIAGSLEKMLDIALPVPRDFERRSAAEYDAYKASFQYQLRNRIIPGIILSAVSAVVLFGLFLFGKNVVYKPLKASSIYKQGYALLRANEFQQSEIKFNEATHWQIQKKWLFRYARGYRDKKQFQRAEKMYRNLLYYFNFDKHAGIEYAKMECDDTGNYEKAAEIAKRFVLDYHVNDIDGILLLGDIYLEWASEKDPTKFEDARKQYATLLNLNPDGDNDLYYARMMRYFIRTDNLREVLESKRRFYPKSKVLEAQDWTELGGYLFDKLYGTLPADQEYLRESIDDVRPILDKAVRRNPAGPAAFYNLSKYFVKLNKKREAVQTLQKTISLFEKAPVLRVRDMYKAIDSHRLLGETYLSQKEFLKAQQAYTDGIDIFENEKQSSGFKGNAQIGKLYADIADIDYFIRGDYESAYEEYKTATQTECDTPSIRYRMGFIEYSNGDYLSAINSFIESVKEKPNDNHTLFAMGNALLLRGDVLASQSYYERLVSNLDKEKMEREIRQLDSDKKLHDLLGFYVKAENNLGVALYHAAKRRASSQLNANALVSLSASMRAWDALTRNKETLVRLGGSNLAEQNMKYMSHPMPEYEPAIYSDIPKTLAGEVPLSE